MSSPLIFVRDDRTLPFIPVTTEALAVINEYERPNRRAYTRSLYLALLQCANESRSDRVAVTRKRLGLIAGMSIDLVSELAGTLEGIGLIRIVEQYHENQRLENEWVLTEPTPVATTGDPHGYEPRPSPVVATAKALEGEEELQEDSLRSSSARRVEKTVPRATGVVALCQRLAELMRENDPKAKVRPSSAGWLDAADKLMRVDERHFEEAMAVLEWSQRDPFWRTNILSMPKFREKYMQLRGRWSAEKLHRNGGVRTAQPSVAELMAAQEKFNADQRERLARRGITPEGPRDQWCPVCKTYHEKVGEQTDAGLITRACPNLPTDDPRYYGSPIYTGDRGTSSRRETNASAGARDES